MKTKRSRVSAKFLTPSSAKRSASRGSARPRLGFLGVGWIGRHRMESISQSGLANIVAIADTSPEAAAQAAANLSTVPGGVGVAVMDSLDELLTARLDGLVIATPSAQHAEQSIRALEHGLHVFCQKPLAGFAEETRRVVDAARAADRLLAVDFSYRFIAGMQTIRELIQSGELGEVFAVNLTFHNAYGPDKSWFYDRRLSGGGCVMDLGVHLVDLALWALDFPRVTDVSSRLFAQGRPISNRETQVEDYAAALLTLENGVCLQLACSWKLSAGQDAVIQAEFYGTRGGAAMRNVNGSFYDFIAERFDGTSRQILDEQSGNRSGGWGGAAAVDWVRRVAAGEGFDPAAEHLVDVAAALDAIYGK